MKKSPLKRGQTTLNKSGKLAGSSLGLSRSKSKLKIREKSPEEKKQQQEDIDKMWKLFNEHWASKDHVCESCRMPIYGQNLSIYHHHCLAKGIDKYKHLKYEIQNLMLLCWSCHANTEAGNPSIPVIAATQRAREKFNMI